MKCPLCSNRTHIYNSRPSHGATQTWRRHRCNAGHSFTTREKVDWTGAVTVITPTDTAPYSRERLLLSLVRASVQLELPSEALSELCDSVELTLQKQGFFAANTQPSDHITTVVITVLRRYNRNLALQYVNTVYRNQPPLQVLKRLIEA